MSIMARVVLSLVSIVLVAFTGCVFLSLSLVADFVVVVSSVGVARVVGAVASFLRCRGRAAVACFCLAELAAVAEPVSLRSF